VEPVFQQVAISIVIDEDSSMWVFGDNTNRQLFTDLDDYISEPTRIDMKVKQVSAGGFHTLVIDTEDRVWSSGENRDGQLGHGPETLRVMTPPKAKSVSAGLDHSFILALPNCM